jgi:hypothetical protein
LLKRMLGDLGIERQRVRLEWISAAEGEKVKVVINEMTEQIKALGPLGLPQRFEEWDREVIELAREIQRQPSAGCACQCAAAQPAPAEVAHV